MQSIQCLNKLKRPGWYLNFKAWFITNALFEQKERKLCNEGHFAENKTKIIHHVLKMQQISLLHKYMK
jgi:hypothetical protein